MLDRADILGVIATTLANAYDSDRLDLVNGILAVATQFRLDHDDVMNKACAIRKDRAEFKAFLAAEEARKAATL